jgi:hypothetical protein
LLERSLAMSLLVQSLSETTAIILSLERLNGDYHNQEGTQSRQTQANCST